MLNKPEVREQVLKIAVDCTGTRETERILCISKDTATAILKIQKPLFVKSTTTI